MKYQPVGAKVLLKILPPKERSNIVIPDHLNKAGVTGEQQFFSIEKLGPGAVDEQHPLALGQTVMISAHPTLLVGVDLAEQLVICNNKDISVICTEDEISLGQN